MSGVAKGIRKLMLRADMVLMTIERRESDFGRSRLLEKAGAKMSGTI
jgi:hypothetical protein